MFGKIFSRAWGSNYFSGLRSISGVFLAALLLSLAGSGLGAETAWPAAGNVADNSGEPQKSSAQPAEDLSQLINDIENPKKRAELVKNLTALKEALDKTAPGEEAAPPENAEADAPELHLSEIMKPVDNLSKRLLSDTKELIKDILALPENARSISDLLSSPENYQPLSRFLLRLGAVILIFITIVQVVKIIRRYHDKRRKPIKSKIIKTAIDIAYEAMPYFIFLFILIPAVAQAPPPSASPELVRAMHVLERGLLSFFYLAVLLYFSRNFTTAVLAPEPGAGRLLPLSDQGARLVHRFLIVLLNYIALFSFIRYGLVMNWPNSRLWLTIDKLMIMPFPLIITFYFLKLQRLWGQERPYGDRQAAWPSRIFGKLTPYVKKYWLAPAVTYIWLMSILGFLGRQDGFYYLIKAILGSLSVLSLLVVLGRLGARLLDRLISGELEAKAKIIANSTLLIKVILAPPALLMILPLWGIPISRLLDNANVAALLSRLVAIMAISLIVFALLKASNLIIAWMMSASERGQMWRTLTPIVGTTFRAGIIFIGLVSILERLGVNVGPILAGAGILGLGVGMGAQSLVKDIINGLTIIMSDTIAVGDWAAVGGLDGTVEAIGLRNVRIRDASGNLSIIPNSSITTITNMTKHYSREVLDVGVSYQADLNRTIDVLTRLGLEMYEDPLWSSDLNGPVEVLGVQTLGDSSVNIRLRLTCKPGRQWALSRALKLLIKNTFDREGIEIPFPQLVVHHFKEGTQPPGPSEAPPEPAANTFSGPAGRPW